MRRLKLEFFRPSLSPIISTPAPVQCCSEDSISTPDISPQIQSLGTVEPHPTLPSMKISTLAGLYALVGLVAPGQAESPTPVTKATVSDKATLGFATQNGGYVLCCFTVPET